MKATSKEGIEQQHEIAEKLVRLGLPCMIMVDRGEIPLMWKKHPTIEMHHPSIDSLQLTQKNNEGEDLLSHVESKENPVINLALPNEPTNERKVHEIVDTLAQKDKGWCISSRGMIDVTNLARLVQEGLHEDAPAQPASVEDTKKKLALLRDKTRTIVRSTTNLWDEANACQNNVHVTRPSHDAWGVKKISLIFCDDFLQTVYELPWWYQNLEMKQAVQPVLDLLHVPQHRLVRLLFASLPPGVTIPVHHDTGTWVKHTHRIHVPIVVTEPDKVLFRCGPTDDCMDRVSCVPGHVFEMNNQGRHAVSNCQTSHHRAHLILDYVDESFCIKNGRIQLSPGEILIQTRRSIDRAIDAGKRPTPSFLILGAQKAGTTSLYEYLIQHPLIVAAKRRETHCLDWRWDETLDSTEKRRKHCLSFFQTKELRSHPSCMTGDSTPSYLLNSARCIPRLKEVFPHEMKFIVLLRNPVRRAQSHYEMVTSLDGTPEQIQSRGTDWLKRTFEEVISLDLKNMKQAGLIPYWDIESGTISDMQVFNRFVGSTEEDSAFRRYQQKYIPLMSGSHSLLTRGMYELQLRPWLREFNPKLFLIIKMEDLARDGGLYSVYGKALHHLDLPPFDIVDSGAKNARNYQPMKEQTRELLQRFYEPHNKRLEQLLGPDWRDPWNK